MGLRPLSLRLQVEMVVIGFLVIGACSVAGNALANATVSSDRAVLLDTWRPAQTASADLGNDYVDQATAELGYVATGDPRYLRSYEQSVASADRSLRRLNTLLADDRRSTVLLQDVVVAARRWHTLVTDPGIRLRANGPVPVTPAQLGEAESIFQELRAAEGRLADHVNAVVADKVEASQDAQDLATWFAIGTGVAAALAAVVAFFVLRNSLSKPLERLVERVEATARDPDQRIAADGPPELARIARAGETMRLGILRHAALEAEANERLALAAEDERIARDLHDTVIQNLYATGLVLRSRGERVTEADVEEAVGQIDRAIRTLRTVIFELGDPSAVGGVRERVLTIAEEAERSLGFPPVVHFSGAIDTVTGSPAAGELGPVLREALSNVARHARATRVDVTLEATDGWLCLTVTDDGVGPPDATGAGGRGLGNITSRAQRLGGVAELGPAPGSGAVLRWRVPAESQGAPAESEGSPAESEGSPATARDVSPVVGTGVDPVTSRFSGARSAN